MKRHALVLASLAFTISGATSLVFQVVWSKALGYLLGNSQFAVATVVAAFLTGLALGAWLAGRLGFLLRRPLVSYGLLEAGIGLFGLVSLALLAGLEPVLAALATRLGPSSGGFLGARFGLTFLVLLPPTVMMGATLPILTHWASVGTGRLAAPLSRFYALNTFGAVAGAFGAGFYLLQNLGLSGGARLAGGTSLVLGAAVALLGRGLVREGIARGAAAGPDPARPAARRADSSARANSGPPRAFVLALVACSGAVALSLEIGWTRLIGLLFGSSVYSFSLVLAAFLLGIALGSALVARWADRVRQPWRLYGALQWVVAAGALWGSSRMAQTPWDFAALVAVAHGHVGTLWLREGLLLAGLILPAATALGALFPLSARLLARAGETPAAVTGHVYVANTLGTVAGTLATGFWLIPVLGLQRTLLGCAVTAAALGMAAWWTAPVGARKPRAERSELSGGPALSRLLPVGLAAALLALGLAFQEPWNRPLLAAGVFRPLVATGGKDLTADQARAELSKRLSEEELVFYRDGRHAVVTVHRSRVERSVLALRVNGKTDASTGADMRTQVLLGQLPMLWAPDSARVLVIGQGSGVTAGSALRYDPSALDVVEIEPAVFEASRLFEAWNWNALGDPRVHPWVDDGRNFLRYGGRTYDVIVSEPSNPWLAGVNNLFTEDFYRLAASHLAPDGVLCQWVQFYELSPTTLASILQAIQRVFPQGQVFRTDQDLIVIALRNGRPLDLARATARLARPRVAADLARVNLTTWADVLGHRVAGLGRVAASLPTAPRNTDDRPYVEYRAPRDFYEVRPGEPPVDADQLMPDDLVADLPTWLATPDPHGAALSLAEMSLAEGSLSRVSRWRTELAARDPEAARTLALLLEAARGKAQVAEVVRGARAALEANAPDEARRLLDRALASSPDEPSLLIERARVSMRVDSLDGATRGLRRALLKSGPREGFEAYSNLGIIAMRRQAPAAGIALFEEAIALEPLEAQGYLYLARAQAQSGNPAAADSTLRRAAAAGADPTLLSDERQRMGLLP